MSTRSSAATHRGTVRKGNEDAMLAHDALGLWVVADGAGGHGAGEVASRAVVDSLADLPPHLSAAEVLAQFRLRLSAVHASLQARSEAEGRARPMATTVVALLLRGEHYAALWAGDSRAYLLRGGTLLRVTRDHSLVQEMVDAGTVAEAEAEKHAQANVITRAVGADGPLELEKSMGRVQPGDLFLLCSDGLFKAMEEREIAARLLHGHSAEQLVDAAVAMGARDNVTAILIRAPD
ncbi:PP2C family protein-serine/threonine phosphatase [Roseomonas chloroacetimidivorans]|jgi:protein phosphatase/serine/threonine-protein phosphatase Stp1|uniref:PP2C family protein-serine/threonine phosphatase n=1 Tax=Roseomonas chloroacetimidivorans TaxID=1766656 RepID=UPI003C790747